MTNESTDDIYERINLLTARERQLREELASVRRERAKLKAQNSHSNVIRPKWMDKLPDKFWYPCYYTSKVFSELGPNSEYASIPADLIDWARSSGVKEFLINTGMYVGIVIISLQIIFIIL